MPDRDVAIDGTIDEDDLGYRLVGGVLTLEQVEGGSTFVYTSDT